ncbi:MAG: 30S ribosomal protein S6 [Bacillota bacterium]
MRLYEVVFVLRPELDEEAVAVLMEKFKNLIESRGGEITRLDKWGKRRLAYEINKVREGIYMLLHYKGEPAIAHELDRVIKITDGVLRFIIVREDE